MVIEWIIVFRFSFRFLRELPAMHLGGVRWPGWDDDGFLQYMLPPWKAETTQRWYPQQVASHICTRTSRWKVWNLCSSKFRYWISVDKTSMIQKPSKVSFELALYIIYIYMYVQKAFTLGRCITNLEIRFLDPSAPQVLMSVVWAAQVHPMAGWIW